MTLRRPIVYFYGQVPGLYEPIYPCDVVGDDPEHLEFRLEADVLSAFPEEGEPVELEARRGYETYAAKRRLHQHRFRELVVGAYRERCSVCRLHHVELLDAAHILPDRDERGRPEIPNGLALCRIHHGAFDTNILGVSPTTASHPRRRARGDRRPMLQHGLKDMHGQKTEVPRAERLRPNPDYLAERFERFAAA